MSNLPAPGTFSKSGSSWGFVDDTFVVGHGIMRGVAGTVKVRLNDGRTYIDWVCGLGANLLGYSHLDFCERVTKQVWRGSSFSLTHELEYTVSEKLANLLSKHVPGWDSTHLGVRFAKTGSDVTTMAVRLARAVTGKPIIVAFKGHYHGWHDWTISRTEPAHGIPISHAIVEVDWEDLGALMEMRARDDIAAFIYEYPVTDVNPIYLKALRETASETGALLISDEIVTGLRYDLGGACERYGIEPDLYCMGKALGNGLPIAALVGPYEYMEWFARNDPVFCSSTNWGEAVSLAAASALLDNWNRECVTYLYHIGNHLIAGLKGAGWNVIGHAPRSLLVFEGISQQAYFIQNMRKYGILMNRPNFVTRTHHIEDVEMTIDAASKIREEMDRIDPDTLSQITQPHWPRVLFSKR